MLRVDRLVVSLFESNCFIVRRDGDDRALVIDPGDEAEAIDRHLTAEGLTVAAYLLTHGHVDHLSALAALAEKRPAPIALHPRDARWCFTARAAMPPYYDTPRRPARIERELADGQTWTDAGMTYAVIELPGHSPGGVGFLFEEERVLFAGDTLFAGSVGRSDLPGSDPAALNESLRRLMTLSDDITVYCGHGPETTIGDERRHNPYLPR